MNTVREMSKFMMKGHKGHIVAILRMMRYRVYSQLLRMTVQFNVPYYGNKQDYLNVDTLMHTYIYLIYLYDWTLNDLVYCHNKTHSTEQSFSVAGYTYTL